MRTDRRGFTLIELLVVVVIMGILASISVPYYYKTIETAKANDAVAIGHLIGNANRMYQIDNGVFVGGQLRNTPCNIQNLSCATATGACKLVACKYIAAQDWDGSAYNYYSCNRGAGGPCCGSDSVSCVTRGAGASANYAGWGYRFGAAGKCYELTATTPVCPKF